MRLTDQGSEFKRAAGSDLFCFWRTVVIHRMKAIVLNGHHGAIKEDLGLVDGSGKNS